MGLISDRQIQKQTLYQLSYRGLLKEELDFTEVIMPLAYKYIANKQKARRARARKSAMRAHRLNGPMRARTRAHIGLASLRFACARARTCAHARARFGPVSLFSSYC